MGIVRETYAKCANVKQILRTLLVKFEERDIFMSNEYQQEIKDRMQSLEVQVPQLYVDGQHIGVSIIWSALLSRIVSVDFMMDVNIMMTICQNYFHFLYKEIDCRKSVHKNHGKNVCQRLKVFFAR